MLAKVAGEEKMMKIYSEKYENMMIEEVRTTGHDIDIEATDMRIEEWVEEQVSGMYAGIGVDPADISVEKCDEILDAIRDYDDDFHYKAWDRFVDQNVIDDLVVRGVCRYYVNPGYLDDDSAFESCGEVEEIESETAGEAAREYWEKDGASPVDAEDIENFVLKVIRWDDEESCCFHPFKDFDGWKTYDSWLEYYENNGVDSALNELVEAESMYVFDASEKEVTEKGLVMVDSEVSPSDDLLAELRRRVNSGESLPRGLRYTGCIPVEYVVTHGNYSESFNEAEDAENEAIKRAETMAEEVGDDKYTVEVWGGCGDTDGWGACPQNDDGAYYPKILVKWVG